MAAYETVTWQQPLKRCSSCTEEKSPEEFNRDKNRKDGRYPQCKTCTGKAQRVYRQSDPERYRQINLRSNLKKRYKLSIEDFNSILKSQGGVCANSACVSSEQLVVDHDHSCCPQYTSTCGECVRGILCNSCNTALGNIGDDVEMLLGLVNYLSGEY